MPINFDDKKNLGYSFPDFHYSLVSQSIVEETINAKSNALDENLSLLNRCFLSKHLEVLKIVGEHVMEASLDRQYLSYYETWYKTVLLSRKINVENITDKARIENL